MEAMLREIDPPKPEGLRHQEELKVPLLSYRRSSKAGLWFLVLPSLVAIVSLLKRELALSSPLLNGIGGLLAVLEGNPVLSLLIPLIALGLPCAAMTVNLLAFSHFAFANERKELIITLKHRPLNIAIFLFSLAILIFFFTPDALSF